MSATDSSSNSASSSQPGSRKAYTGRVSKLLDNFGFIDDEVFFQLSVVRGGSVKLNDQVYVECHYSDHLPFKWNALSVQVLDPNAPNPFHQQPPQQTSATSIPGTVPSSLKLSDPRQDPRNPASSSTPAAYFRPDHASDLMQAQQQQQQQQQQLFASPAVTSVSAPSNTSRAAATFVSEYNQQMQQQQVPDSNGLHGHRNRPSHMAQQQQQQQQLQPQQQAVFDSASAFSRNSSITYTSTPGAAFVSTQIQPVFSVDPSLVSQPQQQQAGPVIGTSRGFPAGANAVPIAGPVSGNTGRSSRWDPAPRSAPGPGASALTGSGGAGGRNNSNDGGGNKSDSRRRDRDRDSDRSSGTKDRFGRDRHPFTDRESGGGGGNAGRGDRGRDRNRSNRLERSTESPVSTTGSLSVAGRPENLPKGEVLKRQVLNHDIRFRYGSKIHVPSDFEALIVNQNFELDIQGIPKPIRYKYVGSRRESSKSSKDKKGDKDQKEEKEKEKKSTEVKSEDSEGRSESVKTEKKESSDEKRAAESSEPMETESPVPVEKEDAKTTADSFDDEKTQESTSQSTTPTTTPATTTVENGKKKTTKYGVKVILLSLPTMNQIYEQVFGYDFDHQTTSGYCYPLNKQISFLAYRNQNDGYSLLGGKFNPEVDGFIPGTEKPDLIRAAIRCVKEQAHIDLSLCSRWISLGTFLYNRNESFGADSCYEYSTVFMPDVWSLLEKPIPEKEEEVVPEPPVSVKEQVNGHKEKEDSIEEIIPPTIVRCLQPDESGNISGSSEELPVIPAGEAIEPEFNQLFSTEAADERKELLSRINDLKVTDLKAELDSRGIKLPRNAKKAELAKLLTEELEKEIKQDLESSVKPEATAPAEVEKVPGEEPAPDETVSVKPDPQPVPEPAQEQPVIDETTSGEKRKADDTCEEPVAKKQHTEDKEEKTSDKVKEKEEKDKSVPAVIEYKGDLSFSVLSLHQALNHHKHDHFELSVAAELVREAMLQHFSVIIASCLKANQAQLATPTPEVDRRKGKAPTYMQLAFSYIDDRNHGYVLAEDVLQLLSLTGFTISKRSWQTLSSGVEKIHYKSLEAPEVMIQPVALVDPLSSSLDQVSQEGEKESNGSAPVYVKNGVMYDIENLVDQRERYTKAQAELKENQQLIAEKVKLLSEFETRQKKMTSAIEKQNDEICGIKREKDSLKIKNEELRKVIDSALTSLNQGMKLIKEETKL